MTKTASTTKGGLPVVLITAGASGIGRTMAQAFIAKGYRAHVCDIDQEAIDKFLASNPSATATLADVSNVAQVADVFKHIDDNYGGLNVLVNNAGIAGPMTVVEDIDPAEWDRTISVNLNGQFYCTRLAVPMIKDAGRGSIINIASNAAFSGCPRRAPYTASKWATIGFTKTLAMELGPFGIRVNAICPGSVAGDRINEVIARDASRRGKTEEEIRNVYLGQSSMRQFIDPAEVAKLAVFLASDECPTISGQALGLDGHTETLSVEFN